MQGAKKQDLNNKQQSRDLKTDSPNRENNKNLKNTICFQDSNQGRKYKDRKRPSTAIDTENDRWTVVCSKKSRRGSGRSG